MPQVNVRVGASADDADELESSGAVNITRTTVDSQAGATSSVRYWAGFRMAVSGIYQYDQITLAGIDIYFAKSTYDIDVNIHCQLAATPGAFTTDTNNIQNRTLTTAYVTWTDTDLGGSPAASPDFTAVVQEVVNAYTPTYIAVILKPRSPATTALVPITSYDGTPGSACRLNVYYSSRPRIRISSTP